MATVGKSVKCHTCGAPNDVVDHAVDFVCATCHTPSHRATCSGCDGGTWISGQPKAGARWTCPRCGAKNSIDWTAEPELVDAATTEVPAVAGTPSIAKVEAPAIVSEEPSATDLGFPWRDRWKPLLAGGIALILIIVLVAVIANRQSRITSLTTQLRQTTQARDQAQGQIQSQVDRANNAETAAQQKVDAQDAARKAALDQREADLNSRSSQLDQQSQSLQGQQAQLDARTAAADANTFGDGLFQVGKDIQAGRYHTDGQSDCYWAKLRSSNTSDIDDNNISSGPQTIVISSPWFESRDCGQWTKVG